MEKDVIRKILKKEGYKKIKFCECLGWDLKADNQIIEVKETHKRKYFKNSSFTFHSDEQVNLYHKGKLTILFIFDGKPYGYYKMFKKGQERIVKRI